MFASSSDGCSTGGSQTACLCSSPSFQQSATNCILQNCKNSTSDQQSAYNSAEQVCSQAGVTLPSWSQLVTQGPGSSNASASSSARMAGSTDLAFASSVGDVRAPGFVALLAFILAGFMLV